MVQPAGLATLVLLPTVLCHLPWGARPPCMWMIGVAKSWASRPCSPIRSFFGGTPLEHVLRWASLDGAACFLALAVLRSLAVGMDVRSGNGAFRVGSGALCTGGPGICCMSHIDWQVDAERYATTLGNRYLSSRYDEECSKMRYII